jgi:phosphatidate cytidylyltransferase
VGETAKRLLSAGILVPTFIFCFHYSGWYYLQLYILGMGIIFLGVIEFCSFADKGDEGKPFVKIALFYAFLLFTAYYIQFVQQQQHNPLPENIRQYLKYIPADTNLTTPIIFILFVHAFVIQLIYRPLEGAILSVSTTVIASIYLGVTNGHFFKLIQFQNGVYYVWIIAGTVFITDAGAYFGGRWFGRHPAGLKISPKKTWEGYITGMITALIFTISVSYFYEKLTDKISPFSYFELFLFTPIFSIISVIGDLTESAMKRDAKMKDSASVVPGHGGVLDLADALLVVMPCSYFYISIKELLGYTI